MNKTEYTFSGRISAVPSVFSVFCFLLLTPLLSYSQSSTSTGGKKVEIVHAKSLKFDSQLGNGAKRLIGDVEFKQENTHMYCDSAYFYENNSLEAFGHIHVNQNDSVHLYGELLRYDGNTKQAIITKNVVADKGDMHLTTEVLNYDMGKSVGFYTTPARITNKDNVLTSDLGYFFSKTDDLTFKKNVVLTNQPAGQTNPEFVINSDTMRYNTASQTTYFVGPTTIKSKENSIYCEDGWYDTKNDISRFSKHSFILTKEQKMFGDSLYYDRKSGIGRAIKNVNVIDTTNKIDIKGDFAIHYEETNTSIVTGHALLTEIQEKDTLFVHADTLKAIGEKDSTINKKVYVNKQKPDNKKINLKVKNKESSIPAVKPNVLSNHLFAYHKVKFYRKDMQGKCDSMVYNLNDSLMHLFGKPTLWSEENQLTADSIQLLIGQKSLKSMIMRGNCFIASQEDSVRYNQIRGKQMNGYFNDSSLYLVHVEGNGQTIYFVKDKDVIKAVNRADCSDLNIYLKSNKIDYITFITKPDATLYPLEQVNVKELRLKNFSWRASDRPKKMKDIFKW